jgi:hypothetical protein
MRNRHLARVCRSCQAPMARQEEVCWRCGAGWASEDLPRVTLRAIAGGQSARAVSDPARVDARLQADRWTNDGGSDGLQAASTPPAAAAARG